MTSIDMAEFEKQLYREDIAGLDAYRKGDAEAPIIYRPSGYILRAASDDGDGTTGDIFDFVASEESEDRMGDVIMADGWDLKNFKKNPVFLFGHDGRQPPIGIVSSIQVSGKQLLASVKFDTDDPFAELIRGKFRRKIMRAVSVGFRPMEFEQRESKNSIFGTGVLFKSQELLELSAVTVPAHPQALRKAMDNVRTLYRLSSQEMKNWTMLEEASSGVLVVRQHTMGGANGVATGSTTGATDEPILGTTEDTINPAPRIKVNWLYESLDKPPQDPVAHNNTDHYCETCSRAHDLMKQFADLFEELPDSSKPHTSAEVVDIIKGVLSWGSVHPTGTPRSPRNSEWDDAAEIRRAGVDDLRIMSAWVDSSNPDVKGSYKLPHHRAGDTHPVVFRALSAAVGALNGARGGVDIPDDDRMGVYEHISRHYRDDFDEEPPELRNMEESDGKDGPDESEDSRRSKEARNTVVDPGGDSGRDPGESNNDKQLTHILDTLRAAREALGS